MRTNPYPVPPSRTWTMVLTATYATIALAGALVLILIPLVPQEVEGVVVLSLWGGLSATSGAAALYGVAARGGRGRYRFEWVGAWGIVAGTSVYLVVTAIGTAATGLGPLLTAAPTMLVFAYAIGLTLTRAVQLSLVDFEARRQVLARRIRAAPEEAQ